MRTFVATLALAGAVLSQAEPAQALKILPPTTILRLTDAMVKQYLACRPGVDRATAAAEKAIPGTTRGDAMKRRRARSEATDAALKVCGFPEDGPWRIMRHSIDAALQNCCAKKLMRPDGETTDNGVAAVQAANQALLRKFKRSKLRA